MRLCLLALSVVCAWAQSGHPTRWPIEKIVVEGNHYYTREQVLAAAGLKVGQVAGKAEFDAARDRLVASGAFASVSYKFAAGSGGTGYVATLQVSEFDQAYPVGFEDLHVSFQELADVLRQKDPLFSMEHVPATQPVIERYVKWIQEFLAAKGVPEKVAGSVTPQAPGEYAIIFRPARPLPAVAEVTFEGNSVLSQTVLREAIVGSAIGQPYTEDRFRSTLSAAIRPLYEARGRVRVSFPELRTEPVSDVKGVHVFVTVDEGESYKLGKVTIDGQTPVSPDALLKKGDFKTGDVANMDKVNAGVEEIRKMVRHAGYMEARAAAERKINDEKKTVDVVVHVTPGPQFTMGKLTVLGLDLEGEAEIKRIWTIAMGKPFNPDYPDVFLKSVREQGLFDNLGKTKADVKVNDQAHTADVTLNFQGDTPGQGKPGKRGRGRGSYLATNEYE